MSIRQQNAPSEGGMARLTNSDGCRPPQLKILRFQSLSQTRNQHPATIQIDKTRLQKYASERKKRGIVSVLPVTR
jgi:hypothetical protein